MLEVSWVARYAVSADANEESKLEMDREIARTDEMSESAGSQCGVSWISATVVWYLLVHERAALNAIA